MGQEQSKTKRKPRSGSNIRIKKDKKKYTKSKDKGKQSDLPMSIESSEPQRKPRDDGLNNLLEIKNSIDIDIKKTDCLGNVEDNILSRNSALPVNSSTNNQLANQTSVSMTANVLTTKTILHVNEVKKKSQEYKTSVANAQGKLVDHINDKLSSAAASLEGQNGPIKVVVDIENILSEFKTLIVDVNTAILQPICKLLTDGGHNVNVLEAGKKLEIPLSL